MAILRTHSRPLNSPREVVTDLLSEALIIGRELFICKLLSFVLCPFHYQLIFESTIRHAVNVRVAERKDVYC